MNEEELLGNAIHSPLAQDVSAVLGEIWWLFLVLGLFMLFKETMKSFVTSIMVLRGDDYRLDDAVRRHVVDGRFGILQNR